MLDIDGSQKSGSGTILRLSIALSGILGESIHLFNIRSKRRNPGLRPQHLEAIMLAKKLCNADLRGAYVGSQEIWFEPSEIKGGDYDAEIGTAGSIPLLIMTVLPICSYANKPVNLHISKGGTDVKNSPTINYLQHVFLPFLKLMGLEASIDIHKYGYYPKGMGEVTLNVFPCQKLSGIRLEISKKVKKIEGISVCTFLADKKVSLRH